MKPASLVLFAFGYPVALGVIYRWLRVVRERRIKWFVAHTAAVSAIVAGQAVNGRKIGIIINGTWLVSSVLWYASGAKKAKQPAQ